MEMTKADLVDLCWHLARKLYLANPGHMNLDDFPDRPGDEITDAYAEVIEERTRMREQEIEWEAKADAASY